jgi:monovalent cation/hydrogen antiporter
VEKNADVELLVIGVLSVLGVVGVNALAPRVRIAAPLLLVLLGIVVSFLPFVEPIDVDPELILAVFLPPLLYSSAVNLPTMEFRRDFRTISALSVLLVVVSTAVLGFLMNWLVPGIGLPVGMALGAILSPTDAVATSIVRQAGVSRRLVIMLEGESLLNDATALVLLRSAVVAMAATVSAWQILADFVFAVIVAVVVGYLVGKLHLWIRSHLQQTTSSVAVSLVVPFVAYLPAQLLGASGLVAAVTAGLVSGNGAAKYLSAQDRITERAVWKTLEMLLESTIFLIMGLELFGLIVDVRRERDTELIALGLGAIAVLVILLIRTAFIAFSLWRLARRARRSPQIRGWIESAQRRVAGADLGPQPVERVSSRLTKRLADLDYLAAEALGPREGVLLVWAGMRGAVTLAAAQSLPADTPHRPLLILTAFVVAVGTLLVQGATLGVIARRLGLTDRRATTSQEEAEAMRLQLRSVVAERLRDPELRMPDGSPYEAEVLERVRTRLPQEAEAPDPTRGELRAQFGTLRLEMIRTQRAELLRLRDLGTYSTALLSSALDQLDAEQIGIELRAES